MNTKLFATVALATSLMGVSGVALGEDRIQTNLRGATTSAAPPAGFDYRNASDADLEFYGIPPRPNEFSQPEQHAAWTRAMAASTSRIVPQLQQVNVFHGPHRAVANSSGTSNNWSGAVAFSGAQNFNANTSFHYIGMEWVVPVARQAYGVCGGTDFSSTWAGIDGYGSNDVLQAGTESDASCSGGKTSPYYAAWYEWYPYGEVRINNFPIAPGDDMFAEIWNTSPTSGHVYFVNYTTNQAVEISFTAPPGTNLVGNSAEWVVERPQVNGGLATLTNYISDYVSGCIASTWSGESFYPGMSSAAILTMIDSNSQPISTAIALGGYALWFQDQGSAK